VNLGDGTGFGELAIMSMGGAALRMATIKTVKSTLLAIMSRSDFNTVILKAKKRTMQRQCDFLKSFVFFRDLTLIKL
jgi:hypothetical protein